MQVWQMVRRLSAVLTLLEIEAYKVTKYRIDPKLYLSDTCFRVGHQKPVVNKIELNL